MSERKRFYLLFLPMLAIFLLPFFIIAAAAFGLPAYYKATFLGELGEKYNRLQSIDEPKITVVGGSSVAFGLDSKMIEDKLGYKTVNFGLYANLGTKIMLDLARENINEGDIFILAPELNAETYSLRFSAQTAAQALDGSLEMLRRIPSDNRAALIGSLWEIAGKKLHYAISGERPENTGAYKKENFNEYGDNIFDRPYNVMTGYGNAVTLDFVGTDSFDEYIDYVNDFVRYARGKGAQVYFSFPPINEDAIMPFNSSEELRAFQSKLSEALDCKVISSIFNYILDEGYFYDSEFHLNNSGVTVRTAKLIDDLKREAGDLTVTLSSLPGPAGRRPDCDDFDLVRLDSVRGWAVASVSEEAMDKALLSVPDEVNGLPVVRILCGAFDGAAAKTVELGRNMQYIEAGAIKNAGNLASLIFSDESVTAITLPDDLGEGCADGFTVYLPPERFDELAASEGLSKVRGLLAPNESFVYEPCGDGLEAVALTETGKTRDILVIPDEVGGKPVVSLAAGALNGSEAQKLIFGKNIQSLEAGSLEGTVDGLEVRLAEGTSGLALPKNPDELGGRPRIYAFSDDYSALAEALPQYADILTADNLCLILEDSGNGWTVTGVNERGAALAELTIPDDVDGKPVRTVAANAFADTQITSLDIGYSVSRLDGRSLAGSAIRTLTIPQGRGPDDISVPNSLSEALATDGCVDGLKIVVDAELYQSFAGDYFWGDYGKWLTPRG